MTSRTTSLAGRVLVDTGAYYGVADPTDAHHAAATRMAPRLSTRAVQLYTTNFILAESHALLLTRRGYAVALRFLDELAAGRTTVVRVTPADEQRADVVIRQYRDKRYSFTDATSFAVMERFGIRQAFCFDRNFRQYGFQVLPEQ